MYSEQEREHLDYEMGSASDLQNAYAVSCMERKPDDRGKVDELLRVGRYVVVTETDIFCPRTDAGMGVHVALEGDYATQDEAEMAAQELHDKWGSPYHDCGVRVLFPVPVVKVSNYVPPADDEIPF